MLANRIDPSKIKVSAKTQSFMDKLHDKAWVKRFLECTNLEDRTSLLRGYNIQDQKEEAVIQFLVDKLDPPKSSVTFESQVRAEMEEQEAKGEVIQDPASEKYWQDRLNAAVEMDLKAQREILRQHYESIKGALPEIVFEDFLPVIEQEVLPPAPSTTVVEKPVSETAPAEPSKEPIKLPPGVTDAEAAVTTMNGIGESSAEKLHAKNIFTIRQFFALTFDEAVAVLQTPLTPSKFKEYFRQVPQVKVI